jgi:2-iminobutanoate/2-iminopropanoate deaminase
MHQKQLDLIRRPFAPAILFFVQVKLVSIQQPAKTLRNLESVLKAAGTGLNRVVKVTVFLHDWQYFPEMNETYAEFFKENPPARSTIQGARWPEGSLVAMEAIAAL